MNQSWNKSRWSRYAHCNRQRWKDENNEIYTYWGWRPTCAIFALCYNNNFKLKWANSNGPLIKTITTLQETVLVCHTYPISRVCCKRYKELTHWVGSVCRFSYGNNCAFIVFNKNLYIVTIDVSVVVVLWHYLLVSSSVASGHSWLESNGEPTHPNKSYIWHQIEDESRVLLISRHFVGGNLKIV